MILRLLLPLLLFIALAALLFSGLGKDPKLVPSPLIGKPAPAFSLESLHQPERQVSADSLKGEAYLLNVFASWCAACRIEHPVLEEYVRRGQIKLVGLNYKDQRSDAIAWLRRFGDPYAEIAWDIDGRVGIDYGVYGAPETFVVDAAGIIRYKHVGPISPEIMETQILPLLKAGNASGAQP
jgi:cytochrome c biogenesis protein CcmG/thiol:disulfide interchange protein DsbE